MKLCLVAGTINRYHPADLFPQAEPGEWHVINADISPRPIHDSKARIFVQPEVIVDIADHEAVREAFRHEGMFEYVRLHHVLEHIPRDRSGGGFDLTPDGINVLRNIAWLLADRGVLDVEVPDVLRVVKAWYAEELDDAGLEQWLYGEQLANHEPADSHRAAYTEPVLRRMLEAAGFHVGSREGTGLALRLIGYRSERPKDEA